LQIFYAGSDYCIISGGTLRDFQSANKDKIIESSSSSFKKTNKQKTVFNLAANLQFEA